PALGNASMRGSPGAIRLLIEHQANSNAPAPIAGYTPLMLAAYCDDISADCVRLLLDKGADAKAKGANGETPVSLAMKRGRSSVVELLDPTAAPRNAASAHAHAAPADLAQIKAAAEKSLSLLQSCGPTFFTRSGCIACHQQSVTSMAVGEARKRGLAVDEKTAREQVHVTVMFGKSYIERFLQRSDQPLSSPPSVGYISLGLAAENYP